MERAASSTGPGRSARVACASAALLLILALLSLAVGSRPLSLAEVWSGLWHRDGSTASIIVWELRMPRTVLAVLVGAALSVAGVVMQALTRNPLAEPGVLGVNAGASLAVVVAVSALGVTTPAGFLWFAFAGSAAAATLVQLIARRRPDVGNARLLLAGVALAATLSSITGTITMYDTDAFSSYRFWVLGSFEDRDASTIAWVAPFIVAGLVLALASGRTLNVVALGEEQAAALGARLTRARTASLAAITLLCGAATAAAGPISFVGLVVPHAFRLLIGADQRRLLAYSLVGGPCLTLAADVIGRVIARPDEIEAGVVTAFVGAPVLLALVVARRSR